MGKLSPVGLPLLWPTSIGVNPYTSYESYDAPTIYVANAYNNTVSVFKDINDKFVMAAKPIPVGKQQQNRSLIPTPTSIDLSIGVNTHTNTIYVANSDDDAVSVIDGVANKVVARVMFNIDPFNSGHIECDNAPYKGTSKAPLKQQLYLYPGTTCTAIPYPDFKFVSWEENLGRNSTQLISLVPHLPFFDSIWDSLVDFFRVNQNKPEATFNITKFGNFTASFKELPPPIPPEYVATLFTVVATAFIGSWLTPTVIGWRRSRTQRKYFKECINQIGRLDKKIIEDKIIGYYADGKLSDVHHQLLNDKISEYYAKEKSSERYGAPFT
jgi:YVTN family beta-propeller protein